MAFDKIYNLFRSGKDNDKESWTKDVIDKGGSEDIWICFLGWRTSISIAKKLNLFPKKGKIIVYQEPNALVNRNPNESKKLFLEVYSDVKQYLNSEVNVLSVSLGNMHGFYIASRYNVKRFVSLLPAPELGRNIWKSCASRKIRKDSEDLKFTQKKYDKILKDFSCCNNCSSLPKNSVFYIAKRDDYIPTEDQLDLVEKLEDKGHSDFHYFYLGHVFSHAYFGLLNTFGKVPWVKIDSDKLL